VTLLTTQQSLTVGDVTNIAVTPVVRDEATGLFVRELRIFTIDAERTSPLVDTPALPPLEAIAVTLRIVSASRASLHIAVPASEF
jgi:hypothetical protein